MKRNVVSLLCAIVSVVGIAAVPATVWAQQATSTNYSVDEAFFGTGGQLCDPGVSGYSASYCATSAAGETVVGNTSSTNYQAQGGQNTYREEYIELIVPAVNVNLGILSSGAAATTSATFSVKTYLASGGYSVINASDPPKYANQVLTALTSPTTSSPGTEQFGINLVANSSPSVGANLLRGTVANPDNTVPYFSNGAVATGYNTTNQFKYVKGEEIANSGGVSSGFTTYTISYLYNISNATPSGEYILNHSLVATSTY